MVVQAPRDLFTSTNFAKFDCAWELKVETAFFRGTATGGGTTAETNQRLRVAYLCDVWNKTNTNRSTCTETTAPLLNAAVTGWNLRDKKVAGRSMTFIRPRDLPFTCGDFVEIYKQSTYKYLLYIEGHCAACRYGFMMRLGSVILKVESTCVADQMWYFPLLKPYVDYVPVAADLSDLRQQIEWCRTHDEECRAIAAAAKTLYERYISREGIVDYMHMVMKEIGQRTVSLPEAVDPALSPAVLCGLDTTESTWCRCPIPRSLPTLACCKVSPLPIFLFVRFL